MMMMMILIIIKKKKLFIVILFNFASDYLVESCLVLVFSTGVMLKPFLVMHSLSDFAFK